MVKYVWSTVLMLNFIQQNSPKKSEAKCFEQCNL